MDDHKPRDLSRRRFLIAAASAAGGTASGLTLASPAPCPPPTLTIAGGNSVSTSCGAASGGLPSITLTAPNSGTFAWTVGHAFRQGDVPKGSYVAAASGASALQADVRNLWPDGSVKYAVLSGISNFTANSPTAVQLGTTGIPSSGSSVPEPTAGQVANVTVDLTPTGTGFSITRAETLRLSDVLGVDLSSWNVTSAGRVRQI